LSTEISSLKSYILAYTYYGNPWRMESGDEIRIHGILTALSSKYNNLIVFNLNPLIGQYSFATHDRVIYVSIPRKFYILISKLIGWNKHYELNPLIKISHYIDELIVTIKMIKHIEKAKMVLVFGSISIFPVILRLLNVKKIVVFDPLANFAQTLYAESRRNFLKLLRYGLFLALHKLAIRSADIAVYPSRMDSESARQMFKLKNVTVVPNPLPVCYNSLEEYIELRSRRDDFDRPYFIMLPGYRGKGNLEAVKIVIKIFNMINSNDFKLIITGPWLDMKKYVKNPSIELTGVVPKEKLKELLAISDYGLTPIFSHFSGTFLKVLAYISAGLDIIASPQSIVGIDVPRGINVYLVRNPQKLARVVKEIISNHAKYRRISKESPIVLCKDHLVDVENLLSYIGGLQGKA